jgi:hypothetical protein
MTIQAWNWFIHKYTCISINKKTKNTTLLEQIQYHMYMYISNIKIVERGKIDLPNTKIHDRSLSCLGTSFSIDKKKRGGGRFDGKLVLWVQTSPLSEMMRCLKFPHESKMPTLTYNQSIHMLQNNYYLDFKCLWIRSMLSTVVILWEKKLGKRNTCVSANPTDPNLVPIFKFLLPFLVKKVKFLSYILN